MLFSLPVLSLFSSYRRSTRASAFIEFALMLPTLISLIFGATEFSQTIRRQSDFSLCLTSASMTVTGVGMEIDGANIDQRFRNCLGVMQDFARARVICVRRPNVTEEQVSSIRMSRLFNLIDGTDIPTNSPLAPPGWPLTEIPEDFFGFGDGACLTQGCLRPDPVTRGVMVFGEVFEEIYALLDVEFCTATWSRSNLVLVPLESGLIETNYQDSFNEVLDRNATFDQNTMVYF